MSNRNCLIFICQFIFFTGVSAQTTYNKFVVDRASWVISEYYCTEEGGPCEQSGSDHGESITNTYYYILAGDSLVDSVRCAKLFMSFCANSCMGCGPPYNPPFDAGCTPYGLVALLYEDTLNHKVYNKSADRQGCWNHYDSLFIDFSLAVGDSQRLIYNMDWPALCDTGEFIVDSVNYTGFQNYPVKTWYIKNPGSVGLTSGGDIQLYEGMGYSYGFSQLYNPGDGTSYARQLVKYCQAGDNSCISPYKPNGIHGITISDLNIAVMPNPSFDFIRVKSADALINKVEVLDMNGRILISSPLSELNIHSLAPAMYLLQIQTNLGIAYRKLVKM